MGELFYLQDSRSNLGSNAVFWNKDGCGYGTNLDQLEVYTLESAQSHHSGRNSDVPLLKSLVDELSVLAVDHQYLPESLTDDKTGEYVIQIKGSWNGNDILFVAEHGSSYKYNDAKVFTVGEISSFLSNKDRYTVFSKHSIDRIARRTFQIENIDKKSMITKAGIKLVKPKRVRPTTGKTRGNCPECGKITWDYNPYENSYCAEHEHEFSRAI